MKHASFIVLIAMWLCGPALGQPAQKSRPLPEGRLIQETPVIIEVSKPMPNPGGGLGTMGYLPTRREAPLLEKVDEQPINPWAQEKVPPAAGATPDPAKEAAGAKKPGEDRPKAGEYTLLGQAGKNIGWFGIVRDISYDKDKRRTRLLLEHKYFDYLTDLHIQVVSLYGAGDFTCLMPGQAPGISPLSLVCIYGKVSKGEDGLPQVAPKYIRVWDWGLFTFMDYGPDKTNPQWVKLRKVTDPNQVYSARPTKAYYEERLGKREEAAPPASAGTDAGAGKL